jgi:hypothetical protein
MAVRKVFETETVLVGTRLITGMGHGQYNTFSGYRGEVILEVGSYHPSEVKNKIVHLLSCKTGTQLGPDIVARGAKAFFGYSEDFIFDVKYQDTFFNCALEVDRALADGLDAASVHARTHVIFQREIDALAATDAQAAALLSADLGYLCTPLTNGRFGQSTASL